MLTQKLKRNHCRICSTKPAIHEQAGYGISQLVVPSLQTSINGKSKSQGVQRHQVRQKLQSYTSTQALTTKNRAQTTRNAHPKAQKKPRQNLLNETSNSRTSRTYGISQLVVPSLQTSINGKSKSQGVQRHQSTLKNVNQHVSLPQSFSRQKQYRPAATLRNELKPADATRHAYFTLPMPTPADSKESSSRTSSFSESEDEVKCLMADDTEEVFDFSSP
ncbi:hypothetical protein F511_38781 [Dorcoceras hygrometricum]|uniref:Uncharacterized protein n=1 Tax=Dorcoceras hygrometricum TaxID=472368 RepID=A0A2Z7C337_9LAMI|nr:hypothetical protein F511_38781 [Dorcoceras hygrometricum]